MQRTPNVRCCVMKPDDVCPTSCALFATTMEFGGFDRFEQILVTVPNGCSRLLDVGCVADVLGLSAKAERTHFRERSFCVGDSWNPQRSPDPKLEGGEEWRQELGA